MRGAGPDDVAKLVSQRERWQRVINETVVHCRRMWFNPRYGSVGHAQAGTSSSGTSGAV